MAVTIGQDVDLSLTERVVPPVVHVRQYDHRSRKIRCTLYAGHLEYPVPAGVTLMYLGTRPDGCVFQYSSESGNTLIAPDSENRVILTITDFMTEVPGRYPVDVVLLDGADVLGCFSFTLSVEEAAGRTNG